MDNMKEILDFQRSKFDDLAMQIPGYVGSMAQIFNETSYKALKAAYENREARREAAAAKEAPEETTIINIKGGYKDK